ncbi:MAG: glycosyltransferase family 39 protein [Acidobacteriaceae bacterium]
MLTTEVIRANVRSNTTTAPRSFRGGVRNFFRPLTTKLHSPARYLAATVLFALLIRLIIVAIVFRDVSAPTFDHNEFGWEMGWTARSIALGRGFSSPFLPITGPTALVPPLYPYLLAGIFKLFGLYSAAAAVVILSLNSLFSALTCIPIYFSLRHAVNTRLARIAAFAWAIYPFSIYFAADRVWDYALTSLLFACCFWAIQRLHLRGPWAWLGFSLLLGLTALSNPSILTVASFLLLFALLKVHRVGGPWLRNALIMALTCAAIWAPWGIRNHRVLHSNSVFRDGFWLEFYAGNHGDTSDSNPPTSHPASNPVEMQKYESLGETAYIAQKRLLALSFVDHHPISFATVSARRTLRFWTGYWSFSRAYLTLQPLDIPNVFFCIFLTACMLRGLWRWWRTDPASSLPYLIALLVFPIPYYLTHSSMDYRQPIEPMILAVVIIGLFGLSADSPTRAREQDALLLNEIAAEEQEEEPSVLVASIALAPAD